MASNLSGVVLDAPTEDPAIEVAGSFTMTIHATYNGGGGAATHSLWLEWDQGTDTWQAIPASGGDAGLYTDDVSSYVDTNTLYDAANPISITVYGDASGTFKIRAHGLIGTTNHYGPLTAPWFTVTVNAVAELSVTTDLDALLQKTLTSTFSLDSLLQRNVPINLSVDGILSALKIIQTNIDAKLWGSYTSDLSIDSLLQQIGIQTTLSVDALIAKQLSGVVNLDALLLKSGVSQTDVDALLSQIKTETFSIDATLVKGGTALSVLDAVLYALGGDFIITSIDAIINKSGLLATLNIDSLLQRTAAETNVIDALLIKSLVANLNLDALLLKSQTALTSIDASLFQLQSIASNMDAILYGVESLTGVISLDALLLQVGQVSTITLDALIYQNLLKTASIDSILSESLSHIINIDGLIQGQMTSSSFLDAVIYSVLMQTGPWVEFVTTLLSPSFIAIDEKPAFIYQVS